MLTNAAKSFGSGTGVLRREIVQNVVLVSIGCLLNFLQAVVWRRGAIDSKVFGSGAKGIVLALVISLVIASRVGRRKRSNFGWWFVAVSLLLLLIEVLRALQF